MYPVYMRNSIIRKLSRNQTSNGTLRNVSKKDATFGALLLALAWPQAEGGVRGPSLPILAGSNLEFAQNREENFRGGVGV